eukprot:1157398-Pelagomonas_calceolata.AAC.13
MHFEENEGKMPQNELWLMCVAKAFLLGSQHLFFSACILNEQALKCVEQLVYVRAASHGGRNYRAHLMKYKKHVGRKM